MERVRERRDRSNGTKQILLLYEVNNLFINHCVMNNCTYWHFMQFLIQRTAKDSQYCITVSLVIVIGIEEKQT